VEIGAHELSRPARPWEFLDAVGKHSGLLGNESGRFEAWVYPIKIFRDFDATFVLGDRRIPASSLVRRLVMHPEGPMLTFASDSFTVNESWLAPPEENGAIVRFEIDTWEPLQIEAAFTRDFQLMWPVGLGGTYMSWNASMHAFEFGEEGRKFAAEVGSPSAVSADPEFFTNSYATTRSTFRLAPAQKGHSVAYIFIAGSTSGPDDARKQYQRLGANPEQLFAFTRKYYEDYLARTLSLELPDRQLQASYDWARISTIQGLVANPFLGTGLVAGYRSSGETARPGFAWFFGRDSLWTDLALDSIGDFETTRTALEFIAKYQRQDGKIEHEISQTASLVNWWTGFPYAYASADATPLFLIAMNDYVRVSGDTSFVASHWDNAWRAYQFLKSTYDANGLPRNFGIGHGWVEGGPLLPVETESYQSGLATAALDAAASLARVTGKQTEAATLQQESEALRKKINDSFWDSSDHTLVFALDRENKQVRTPTVLSTAPMWFDAFDEEKANATIDRLANWDEAADWGMRIISERSPLYGPTGYHYGSVWPLFTGWASVAEYRNHRPLEAYANLRANSLLALDGSLGHVTEVLSGAYYEGLGTASPHQIWSSAMVLSPAIRGMLGLSVDEANKSIVLAPHVPADWNDFAVHGLHACGNTYEIAFHRSDRTITFNVTGTGSGCTFTISPAISKHARILGATLNGRKLGYKIDQGENDQHVAVRLDATGEVTFQVADDFGLVADADLPELGAASSNLKISHEQWSPDRRQLTIRVAGLSGRVYRLRAYGAKMQSVGGGDLKSAANGEQIIEIAIPPANGAEEYVEREISIHF
jgi:glycogen debranching enzyme